MNKILVLSSKIYEDKRDKKLLLDTETNNGNFSFDIRDFTDFKAGDSSLFEYSALVIDLTTSLGCPRWDEKKMIKETIAEYKSEDSNWKKFINSVPDWVNNGEVVILLDGHDNTIDDKNTYIENACVEFMDGYAMSSPKLVPIPCRDLADFFDILDIQYKPFSKPESEAVTIVPSIPDFNPEQKTAYRSIKLIDEGGKETYPGLEKIAVIKETVVACAIKRGKGYIVFLPQIAGKDYFQNILKVLNYYIEKTKEIIEVKGKHSKYDLYIHEDKGKGYNKNYFNYKGMGIINISPNEAHVLRIIVERAKKKEPPITAKELSSIELPGKQKNESLATNQEPVAQKRLHNYDYVYDIIYKLKKTFRKFITGNIIKDGKIKSSTPGITKGYELNTTLISPEKIKII
ncbi:MAG: hypothetical protein WC614_04530 [bacterium]